MQVSNSRYRNIAISVDAEGHHLGQCAIYIVLVLPVVTIT